MPQLMPEVSEFITSKPNKMFVGGEWVSAANNETFEDRDPGHGSVIATVAAGGKDDIDRAVQAAEKAFQKSGWATMKANDRAVIIHRLADLVQKNVQILAQMESLDVGMPVTLANYCVMTVPQNLRYYADLAVNTRTSEPIAVSGFEARSFRAPYGVCAFIIPWNYPINLLSSGISPALAAGNTVVVKPAEDSPLTALYFCKLAEEAGIPKGVINVVSGLGETAGAALANHPGIKRMSFTGSPEVGRLVAEACGRNLVPVKLELGGKGAAIVFDDVDLDRTALSLVQAVTMNTGQTCCTATRWVIQEEIYDSFVEKASSMMEKVQIGHSLDAGNQMGPVINEKQRKRILGYLEKGEKEGAKVVLRGGEAQVENHDGGYYVKPALLSGNTDNICAQEEIFGPVAYILKFSSQEEAVDIANSTPYGLGNSVWTNNMDQANSVAEQMIAGNNWINAHNIVTLGISYAGVNKSGLGGGVMGPETLLDYMRPTSIIRPK